MSSGRARTPRGRPPDAWRVARDARPAGAAPSAYEDLGKWLARALRAPRRGLRGVEETGRLIGRELAPDAAAPPGEALEATLIALGFQPISRPREGGGLIFCLDNCPYRTAVRENQPAVCTLHKGITLGLLDVLDPGARLATFEPHDPDEAGCVIEIGD